MTHFDKPFVIRRQQCADLFHYFLLPNVRFSACDVPTFCEEKSWEIVVIVTSNSFQMCEDLINIVLFYESANTK